MLVATSEEGIKNLKQEITKEYYELPLVKTEEDKKKIKELIAENEGKIAVLVTGEGKNTDAAEMLKVLRAMGMEKVLVESPTYCHHMMREGLLDEIFINTSCIFVGGQATGIGTSSKSFPSTDHPHSEIVTMHMHSPHFIYTRYKMLYGIKQERIMDYRTIQGVDGEIRLDKVILGASSFGANISKELSYQMMDRYYEIGGRTIDTARFYAMWIHNGISKSEKTVGDWLRDRDVRDQMTIITNGGLPDYRNMLFSRLAPECIEYDINTSLCVLDLDYVDIYCLHRDDERIPVGEIVDVKDNVV